MRFLPFTRLSTGEADLAAITLMMLIIMGLLSHQEGSE